MRYDEWLGVSLMPPHVRYTT
nr:hypothetical protein [Mesorhizobium tianshanense]